MNLARDVAADVTFLGNVYGETKLELLRHATAVAFASLREGQPIAMLEAMAANVPVLAPTGMCSDYAVDNVTAWIYEAGDSVALCRRILGVHSESEQLRKEITSNARAHVEKTNHPDIVAIKHEELYFKCTAAN